MTDRCFGFEELDEILRCGSCDSRMRHIEVCPRCRSRMALCRSYLALHAKSLDHHEASDPDEVDAGERLQEVLDQSILESPGEIAAKESGAGPFPWFHRLLAALILPRRVAPMFGAVVLLVAAVLAVRTWHPWTDGGAVFREAEEFSGSRKVTLAPPVFLCQGGVELRWRSIAEVDAYRVRLLDSRFEELARFDVGRDTVLVLTAEEMSQPTGRPAVAFWLVEGFNLGDRIVASAPSVLIPPNP